MIYGILILWLVALALMWNVVRLHEKLSDVFGHLADLSLLTMNLHRRGELSTKGLNEISQFSIDYLDGVTK